MENPSKRKRVDQSAAAIASLGADDVDGEEGDFVEDSEDDAPAAPVPAAKQAQKGKAEEDVVDVEEIAEMQRVEAQFKSNLFRLQVVELLREVRADRARASPLEAFLRRLKEVLDSLPESAVEPAKAQKKRKGPTAAAKATWKRPERVELVGSYTVRMEARPLLNLDVAVQIPSSLLEESDAEGTAEVYLKKRTQWICGLAERLHARRADIGAVSLRTFVGDSRKPVVAIAPPADVTKGSYDAEVRLIPVVAEGVFPPRQPSAEGGCEFARNAVAEDSRLLAHAAWLHEHAEQCESMREAVALLKAWLHCRSGSPVSLAARPDGINGFLLSVIVAHLFDIGRVTRKMSSYQIFRVVMAFVAGGELAPRTAMMLRGGDVPDGIDEDSMEDAFAAAYDVAIVDAAGLVNLAARVSRAGLAEFCADAKSTLEHLDADCSPAGGFDELFLTRTPASAKFDCIVRAKLAIPDGVDESALYAASGIVCKGDKVRRDAHEILQRAIGTRCLLLRPLTEDLPEWAPENGAKVPSHAGDTDRTALLSLGIVLNPETCLTLVERGPSANDDENSQEFRKLWGDKAEVRRFKDGAIIQATVWDDVPRTQRHLIVKHMCQHLLSLHFGVRPVDLYFVAAQLDPLLFGEEESLSLVTLFEDLSKRIREVELPLPVRSILPTSAVMRYTEVCPPHMHAEWPTTADKWIAPIRGVIRFELSSSWPNDVEALRKVKTAFFVKLSQGLRSMYSISSFAYPEQLEVFYKGYAFAFSIHTDNELNALRRSPEGAAEAAKLVLDYVHLPPHHSAIHGMALRYTSFTKAVRLAKRWVHSHMFARHIRDEVIEILVAHVYCHHAPFPEPSNHLVAFLRFLRLVAGFSQSEFPVLLITDFGQPLEAKDHIEIQEQFQTLRDEGKLTSALFLSTPYDRDRSVWTRSTPTPMIMRRMATFAKSSAEHLEKLVMSFEKPKAAAWQMLFRTPLADYNIIVKLDRSKITRAAQQPAWLSLKDAAAKVDDDDESEKPAAKRPRATMSVPEGAEAPVVGFDTVSIFIDELHKVYGSKTMLFYDDYGGDVVAVVLTPAAVKAHPFKLQSCQATIPSGGEGMVVVNPEQLAVDIEHLGHGLVVNTTLQSKSK